MAINKYLSVSVMLRDCEPMFWEMLNDDDRATLDGVDDYEPYCYETDGELVKVIDTISEEVVIEQSMESFLSDTLKFLE